MAKKRAAKRKQNPVEAVPTAQPDPTPSSPPADVRPTGGEPWSADELSPWRGLAELLLLLAERDRATRAAGVGAPAPDRRPSTSEASGP
jgi:hypothetical protein